ncbi:MAG: UDP-N-acetylmuramoyl-L-alanyl-D-glutamate--2,6-diaminopimelate ligase [Spirochaetales bacterium]|uniref:UDP-N-acetylmuramyl-tripeptide synthetase n=1 Tax=Candidatus Thalassospirochaeta sargassi TaxID=3119039 RepID=A0AAJ1MLG9_9SPIO|nr:UDP-N-acetylmuramoyl-L-alanyl-D-glutamate--2,6-diaminopimelate ligase [Spirochaetales bacterium]
MQNNPKKRLSALTGNINIKKTFTKTASEDPDITGIAYDSRAVEPGFLFIALPGIHVDGHNYIEKAVEQGAAAVLYSDPEFDRKIENSAGAQKTAFIRTVNTRTAMAPVAAAFYDRPADKMTTIGVTGTDGKTSTVYCIDQLLELLDRDCGFVSTAACKTASAIEKNPYRQSTPEAVEINMMLSRMLDSGKSYAVIESTSHGLSPLNNRLGEISFDAAVFTNISHEHLEFHGTFERYRDDKANLFRKLRSNGDSTEHSGFGVVNLDDENAQHFINAAAYTAFESNNTAQAPRVYTCSLKNPSADFYAHDIEARTDGSSFSITINTSTNHPGTTTPCTVKISIGLPGLFNIENTLEAFAVVHMLTGTPAQRIAELMPELAAVKGRMKVLDSGQPFTAVVDYAHTPGSFERLFPDMREQTRGRLIAVFGSAGERDVEKRPVQGEIAARYADIIVLTDEDPRGDDAVSILEHIAAGAERAGRETGGRQLGPLKRNENLFLIPDRKSAIRRAFELAEPDDTVIMLGKGHESTIIYADGPIPWDEQTAAEEALAEMGFKK